MTILLTLIIGADYVQKRHKKITDGQATLQFNYELFLYELTTTINGITKTVEILSPSKAIETFNNIK